LAQAILVLAILNQAALVKRSEPSRVAP